MADLVRSRAEIECLIEDFKQAGESGQQKRQDTDAELQELENRIETVSARIEELGQDLEERVAAEKEAKET